MTSKSLRSSFTTLTSRFSHYANLSLTVLTVPIILQAAHLAELVVLAVGERWPVLVAQASAYDFYMVPHCSIMKGTCQPSHFHVVYDDLKLSPDDLQAFMYQLCHAYGRATKVVSRPAPVYYAHLAAFHASFYNVKYKADAEVYGAWGETASVTSGSHATTQTAAADIQVAPNLKNILHYV